MAHALSSKAQQEERAAFLSSRRGALLNAIDKDLKERDALAARGSNRARKRSYKQYGSITERIHKEVSFLVL